MPLRFPFKSAVFKGESGQTAPLGHALADLEGSPRRPLRVHLQQQGKGSRKDTTIATVELSRAEAYAFSEWLDAVATQPPAERKRNEPGGNPQRTPRGT